MSTKIINIECDVKDYLSIGEFTPLQGNLKTKTKEQLTKLKNQIIKYGFSFPLFVCKVGGTNLTMDGHGRDIISAELKEDGYKFKRPDGVIGYELPVVYVFAQTKTEAKEKLLALNSSYGKITEEGLFEFINEEKFELNFDEIKLNLELPELNLERFGQKYFGKTDEQLDDVPEVQKEAVSKLGDLFLLDGRHRVLAGDSTKRENVELLMSGKKADMVFTSPPYNVGHNIGYKTKSKYVNYNDNRSDYKDFIVKSVLISLEITDNSFYNVQLLSNNKKDIIKWLSELLDYFGDIFYWKKLQVAPMIAENVANSQTEIIILFNHKSNRVWGNKKFRGTVSNFIETKSASGENKIKDHNATFPIALPLYFLENGYEYKSLICDLFIGCGSTLIACEQTNRICYGMEIDEHYIDVILRRYHNLYPDKEIKCLSRNDFDFDKLFTNEHVSQIASQGGGK